MPPGLLRVIFFSSLRSRTKCITANSIWFSILYRFENVWNRQREAFYHATESINIVFFFSQDPLGDFTTLPLIHPLFGQGGTSPSVPFFIQSMTLASQGPFTYCTSTRVKNAASCRTSPHVDVQRRALTWGHDASWCGMLRRKPAEIKPVLIYALCDARQRALTCGVWMDLQSRRFGSCPSHQIRATPLILHSVYRCSMNVLLLLLLLLLVNRKFATVHYINCFNQTRTVYEFLSRSAHTELHYSLPCILCIIIFRLKLLLHCQTPCDARKCLVTKIQEIQFPNFIILHRRF